MAHSKSVADVRGSRHQLRFPAAYMTAADQYPVPPVPAWLARAMPDPAFQVQFLKKDNSPHWVSNVGPQTWTLLCPFDEILIGGRRGGSKTSALIAWFAMGDP